MIVVDANLLLYSVNTEAVHHGVARKWLEDTISAGETVMMPWISLLAFIRLSTRAGIFSNPLPIETALDIVETWLNQPNVDALNPGPGHARILRALLVEVGSGGNLTSDAHLAAVAIENRAVLYSADSDFARFPGLRWRNPLRK